MNYINDFATNPVRSFSGNFGTFRKLGAQPVHTLGVTRYSLSKLINQGQIEKKSHGLNQKTRPRNNQEYDTLSFINAYMHSKPKGCIYLWSALVYYDLVEEFIEIAWIYIP